MDAEPCIYMAADGNSQSRCQDSCRMALLAGTQATSCTLQACTPTVPNGGMALYGRRVCCNSI